MPEFTPHGQQPSDWIDRGWYLVTEFEKSSSVNFQKALTLAQTHPGFIQLMDERNILIYRNIYREHDIGQFQQLYGLVKKWKGTRLYFKGEETSYENIESGVRCYFRTKLENRSDTGESASEDAETGCNAFDEHSLETDAGLGCIGCRRSGVIMEWPPEAGSDRLPWFFHGRLDQYQVYNLDKEEIRQFVYGHLILYASCPLLDLDKVSQFAQRLPERIDPRKDREWEYRKTENSEVAARFYRLPGVLPKSPDAYRRYLKRIL